LNYFSLPRTTIPKSFFIYFQLKTILKYFNNKISEFNDPTDPSKGKTGNIIYTLNEKWHKPEHIQNHIGKAKGAPHFPKFAAAMQYANVSVMGEIFYELKK